LAKRAYLKGLTGARIWSVVENTKDAYVVGAMIPLPGAQELSKEVQRDEFTIYADDGVWDSGTEYKYEDLTFKIVEIPLELEAKLSGGEYDPTTKIFTSRTTDTAPDYAFGCAALMADGEYRMYVYPFCKLMAIKVDHVTRGENAGATAYSLTLRNTQINKDNQGRFVRDSTDGTYDWLDNPDVLGQSTGPQEPEEPEEPEFP